MDDYSTERYPEWYSEIPPLQREKYIEVYGAFMERFARAIRRIVNKPIGVFVLPNVDRSTRYDNLSPLATEVVVHVTVRAEEERWGWDMVLSVHALREQRYCEYMVHRFIKVYADKVLFFLERESLS